MRIMDTEWDYIDNGALTNLFGLVRIYSVLRVVQESDEIRLCREDKIFSENLC